MSSDSTLRQLSLNIAAITVALFTFSILLGPFLHLSAALPAAITFGLLVITTVDQLAWQGQGANLCLDSLAQCSPAYRHRLIHHEAGHFLAAYFLGLPIQDYSLSAWAALRKGQPGQPGVSFLVPQPTTDLSRQQLDAYATVWMAGIAAEQLTYENAEGGEEDCQKVAAVAQILQVNRQLHQRQALQRAQSLLASHAGTYAALVGAMTQQALVAECLALCSEPKTSAHPAGSALPVAAD